MKSKITAIGGIFFKTGDTDKTKNWYKEFLGLPLEPWGAIFQWRDFENPEKSGMTTWSPFAEKSDYFGSPGQTFMINYCVEDLEGMLAELEEKGIKPVKPMEAHEYGKFAWIEDCDGNRVELWEPAADNS